MEGEDGKWYFSVYDFINFVTGHELSSSYARTLFCRLVKNGSEHANEVASNCSYFQFPCQGQKSTPCMTIRGLQRLLMILGGKVASEFREIVEGVFTRYMWVVNYSGGLRFSLAVGIGVGLYWHVK